MFKLVPADPVSGLDRHLEDFHEFFRSRGVSFGSPGDLLPFVARIGEDVSFRDEMASMVRTAIYRERDGFSRLELVDLVAAAVGGAQVENAEQPEIREAVRQVMAFVESVFRTRWNPGAAGETPIVVARPDGDAVAAEALQPAPVEIEEPGTEAVAGETDSDAAEADPAEQPAQNPVQPHATTDLFYRAQMVAGAEPAEAIAEERKAEHAKLNSAAKPQVDPGRVAFRPVEPVRERLFGVDLAADDEALPVRSEATEAIQPAKKSSRFWMWTACVCALLLAFCAGLIVHQRLLVPLRDPNEPYEQAPADTAPEVTREQAATAGPVVRRPPVGERRAEEARWRESVRRGGGKSGGEFAAPVSRAAARHGAAGTGAGAVATPSKPVGPVDRATESAAAESADRAVGSAGEAADLQPKYMAPAMLGASPALMASRLVYAPPVSYPMLAEMSRIQGRVLVEAVVGKSGRVIRAEAISGHRLLRGAAIREVYERRYRPYLLNDRPTDVATIVSVDFRLK
jgi:outer membrane biosynthesis protein TonB